MEHEHKSTKNIKTAFLLNLFFSIVELVGGIFTNSISIISDSIHDFGDATSILAAWYLEKKSEKGPDKNYTYGYARYSVLGALITSAILLVGSIVMLYNAIPRLINPVYVKYDGMIILGIFGLVINGAGALVTAKGERINERAISLHLLEDVLGWVAVFIVSIVMKIFDIPILDPILSICITIYILYHVFRNLKSIFEIFLEKSPDQTEFNEFKEEVLKENKEILGIHHIHIWTMDGNNTYVTMHVLIGDNSTVDDVMKIKKSIRDVAKKHGINHTTVEIEFEKEECENQNCEVKDCENCHHHHHHHI